MQLSQAQNRVRLAAACSDRPDPCACPFSCMAWRASRLHDNLRYAVDSCASALVQTDAAAVTSGLIGSASPLAGPPVTLLGRASAAAPTGCGSAPCAAAVSVGAAPVLARLAGGSITVDGVDALSAISCHISRAA